MPPAPHATHSRYGGFGEYSVCRPADWDWEAEAIEGAKLPVYSGTNPGVLPPYVAALTVQYPINGTCVVKGRPNSCNVREGV